MINSRKIEDLHPIVQIYANHFLEKCKEAGIDLLITSTYRDAESQNALFNQGRTTPGHIVTNARAGYSFHNFKVAMDVVPLVDGKADWNSPKWSQIGQIGRGVGLFWGHDWIHFKEMAHFQYTGRINDYTEAIKHFRNGGTLEEII
jgi:peptidoglycan L-alanyl-D-glutamate endopeptidase CwlK